MKSHLDLSGLKALEKKLKDLERKQVEFGYPEGSGQHSDAKMPYAQLAIMLEYGTRSDSGGYAIPPRPALRDLSLDLKSNYTQFELVMKKPLYDYLVTASPSPTNVYRRAGQHLVNRYQNRMEFWIMGGSKNQHNAPYTIAMKGFDQPYMETGELIRNATYRVK